MEHYRGTNFRSPDRKCEHPGCDRKHYCKGYCAPHYERMLAGADMDPPLRRWAPGEWGEWRLNTNGYVVRTRQVGGKRQSQLQHRFVMMKHLGRPLSDREEVHHKNGDRTDNRLSNLEVWNTSQPLGQRVEDKVEYALEIMRLYAPEELADGV